MKIWRIVVVCQLLKGQQKLVCFDLRRGILTAELPLTGRAVFFLLSWRCTGAKYVNSSWTLVSRSWSFSGPEFHVVWLSKKPVQDEDHSGSSPHSFPGLCHMRCWTSPEQGNTLWISGFMRQTSRCDKASNMLCSVLLNCWDNLFLNLPSISSETWSM